ncbi:MAG TPA: DUF488 domain-containing protein [Rhodanobacteraceae bacterium]|nr:DUF488 domain-containing protein [Rhodanobacteraceae bacterium]
MALPAAIWTIGHSTRGTEEFLSLLGGERIEALADVRRFPGSRKYPHFNADVLARTLPEAGIEYAPFPELGGRRKPLPDSPNTAWRNDAFRGYADFMRTPEFASGIGRLSTLASAKRTAIMCSEAVWWRCHRGLIADWLKLRGVQVLHILDARQVVEHPYTSAAHVTNGELDYREHG